MAALLLDAIYWSVITGAYKGRDYSNEGATVEISADQEWFGL